MPRAMPEQIEKPHSSLLSAQLYSSAACLSLRDRKFSAWDSGPLRAGGTRPVFCKVLADRTQGPLMGSRLIPEHRDIPRCPPRPPLGHHPIAIKI
jgi:hypothetical protein